jgi:hypothetical protein
VSAVDVLQCRQPQAGQTKQVLGFGKAPVFAASAQHGFNSLAQALLIALKLGDQTAALFELICGRQLRQTRTESLLVLLEGLLVLFKDLGLRTHILQLTGLLLIAILDRP